MFEKKKVTDEYKIKWVSILKKLFKTVVIKQCSFLFVVPSCRGQHDECFEWKTTIFVT